MAAGWRVEIGRAVVDAGSREADAAIKAENDRHALPGLAPELNPYLIDPAKWRAFVAAVTPQTAKSLRNRPLFLDLAGLRIGASSPTTPASFGPSLRLTLGTTVGQAVIGRTDAPYDCGLARTRADAAKRRAEQADQRVRELEGRQAPAAVERQVRYAAALAWRENAAADATCRPGDQAAAGLKAATEAARAFEIVGGSME